MKTQHLLRKALELSTLGFTLGFSGNLLAGEFDGTWDLSDTQGKPYTAILSKDGTASGTHGDSMKHGTWSQENGAAVIHWKTGWTTRIEKQGDHFVKKAYKPGSVLTGKPDSVAPAVKQK